MTKKELDTVKMLEKVYIKACGKEKWESLTSKEKHDAIMVLANITLKTLNKLEEAGE